MKISRHFTRINLLWVLFLCFCFTGSKCQDGVHHPESIGTDLKALAEPEGVRITVKLKNLSEERVEIFGARYPFGRLEISGDRDISWEQVGSVNIKGNPELIVIEPGKEYSFDYFVRVKSTGTGFELEMAKGESFLAATLDFNEKLKFKYKYSFLRTSESPWSIGFLNIKKQSVFRGQFESKKIDFEVTGNRQH